MNLITVIIPVYNAEKYLRRCLDSLLKQTYKKFDTIIINDGSIDSTSQILREYKNRLEMIVYEQVNSGQAKARNFGIKMCQTDYLTFVDADDEVQEDYIEALFSLVSEKLDLGIIGYKRIFEYKPNVLEKMFPYINTQEFSSINVKNNASLLIKIFNAPYGKIYKRKFICDHAIEFDEGKFYEDLYFTITLLLNNPCVKAINRPCYLYYVHKGSTMTKGTSKILDIFDVFDKLFRYAKEKELYDFYVNELEYLAMHHILIGTVYRLFIYDPGNLLSYIKLCLQWYNQNGFSFKNDYLKSNILLVKVYINTLRMIDLFRKER